MDKQYRVIENAPHYLIGHGPDNEFVIVATTLVRHRADKIAECFNNEINDSQVEVKNSLTSEEILKIGLESGYAEAWRRVMQAYNKWANNSNKAHDVEFANQILNVIGESYILFGDPNAPLPQGVIDARDSSKSF